MPRITLKDELEKLYRRCNTRIYVHPDPIEFLYEYEDLRDREIVGMIASSLAYGRVVQILKSVRTVLEALGPSPYLFLVSADHETIRKPLEDFVHRFARGGHVAALLWGIKQAIVRYGSLYNCFASGMSSADENLFPAMCAFAAEITGKANGPGHLVACPEKGSACKRLNLYLRWMVRKDRVDPGGWDEISPGRLIIPLDTHMHRIGLALKLTNRKQADLRTALELTSGFKAISPDDPLKYDFALTRLGIRSGLGLHPADGFPLLTNDLRG